MTRPSTDRVPPYGSVVLAVHEGRVVTERASGWALRYADAYGTELPRAAWVATATDTIFDFASLSKLFTTIAALQQMERGRIDLDRRVAAYLPGFGGGGKHDVTVRQLLAHTSGLPAGLPLWRDWPTPEARIAAVLATGLVAFPGEGYVYSDLNMIVAGMVAEAVAGERLDVLVSNGIAAPLGMNDAGYNPDPLLRPRIAATEYQATPPRGLVHGQVHDENAWALGGVTGHAGIFGTARDLARLAQAILDGGRYNGARILEASTVDEMLTDQNSRIAGQSRGLGFELDRESYMGTLASPTTAGHTGFTGTSIVIDVRSRSYVILLTNRVHPSRTGGTIDDHRRAVADELAARAARPNAEKRALPRPRLAPDGPWSR